MANSKVTTAGKVAREYCTKFPELPSRTLARTMCEQRPKLFDTVEHARSFIRIIRGNHGSHNRKETRDKKLFRPNGVAGMAFCPEPIKEPRKPFLLEGACRLGIMSDVHIPYHDRQAVESAVAHLKSLAIDTLLLNGDILDFYCVGLGTRILTADMRWVAAETLKVGDPVVGFDEWPSERNQGGRKFRTTTVTATGIKMLPMYEIELEDGTILRSTDEHRWICDNGDRGWIRTDGLTVRKSRSTRLNRFFRPWEPPTNSWTAGYLSGAFDADGTVTKCGDVGVSISFAQNENAMLDKVKALLDEHEFPFTAKQFEVHERGNYPSQHVHLRGGRQEMCRFLGMMQPPRLLSRFGLDGARLEARERLAVVRQKYLGLQPAVTLSTGTKTYIAEGFGAHNTCSRFDTDPEQRNTAYEVRQTAEFLLWIRECFPKARLIFKEGNHDERYSLYLWRNAPALWGLKQLRLPAVLGWELAEVSGNESTKLEKYGWEYVTDKRMILAGKLPILHGHEMKASSGGVNAARAAYVKASHPVLIGHLHKTSQHTQTDIMLGECATWSVGCLCSLDPDYMPYSNKWNHGAAFVEIAADGEYNVHNFRLTGSKVRAS
jgi:predicted phosphodiesterase